MGFIMLFGAAGGLVASLLAVKLASPSEKLTPRDRFRVVSRVLLGLLTLSFISLFSITLAGMQPTEDSACGLGAFFAIFPTILLGGASLGSGALWVFALAEKWDAADLEELT